MSIYAYVGLPGSGKSYNVVANVILSALKEDRLVVTNIPVYEDKIRELVQLGELREFPIDKVQLEPALLEEYAPPGCVLVMDELWKLFPAGQKVDKVPTAFKSFLAEHRHMVDARGRAIHVVFVTQDLSQISMFARQLVEQTFLHTQLGHLGMSGRFQCEVFHRAVTGGTPPSSRLITKMMGRYEPRIYNLYKSNTMSQAGSDGAMEKAVDARGNVWKRPGVLISFAAAIILLGWGVSTLASVVGKKTEKPAQSASLVRAAPAARAEPSNEVSHRWRLSAIIEASDPSHAWAILVDDLGGEVWIPASECVQSRMQWRCNYQNKWWTLAGIDRKPEVDRRSLIPDNPPSQS